MHLSLIKSLFIFSAWLPSKILHIYDHGVHEHASLITFEWVGCFQPNLRARQAFQSCHVATKFSWKPATGWKREIQRLEMCRVSSASVRHHKNDIVKALTLGRASMESYKRPRDRKSQYTKSYLNIYSEGYHNKSKKNVWPSRYSTQRSRQDS